LDDSNCVTDFIETNCLKSLFETTKSEYLKAIRNEKLESSRTSALKVKSADARPPVFEHPNTFSSNKNITVFRETEKLEGQQKTNKTLLLNILSINVSKHPVSSTYQKFSLKMNQSKEVLSIELEGVVAEGKVVPKARIDISFTSIVSMCISREEEVIIVEYKKCECSKENGRKKSAQSSECKISELVQIKENEIFQESKVLSLKVERESFQKLLINKSKILERLKSVGINITEVSRSSYLSNKSDLVNLPIKEITNLAEIEELRKREANLQNAEKKRKLEALKLIDLPKISEASQKLKICPVYSCGQTFSSANNLKTHISAAHPELDTYGLAIDTSGVMTYPDEIINTVLMVVKIFPNLVTNYVLEDGKQLVAKLTKDKKT